jgi:hypothetical protein
MNMLKYLCFCIIMATPLIGACQTEEEELILIAPEELDEEVLTRMDEVAEEASVTILINRASAEDLLTLPGMVYELAEAICAFRDTVGPFVSIYELLSIPGMEKPYLRSIAHYLSLAPPPDKTVSHTLSLRSVLKLESPAATLSRSQIPSGSPYKVLLRYKAEHRHWIAGFKAEKDAGEPFGGPIRPSGFDFYSAYAGYRGQGFIRQLLVGDYRISMGHGLLCNQSFSSGSDASALYQPHRIKILRPHTSADEYLFFRGGAIRMQHRKSSLTLFGSIKPIDGNIIGRDTMSDKITAISTIQKSGIHSTPAELEDRHAATEYAAGGSLRIKYKHLVLGANLLHVMYDVEIRPSDRFSDRWKFRGNRLTGASLEAGWYSRIFGLAAELASTEGNVAWNMALVMKVNDKVSFWVSPRHYAPGYYSPYASSIGRGTNPTSEQGVNFTARYTPEYGTNITARTDVYHMLTTTGAPVSGRTGRTFMVDYTGMKQSMLWVFRVSGEHQYEPDADIAWQEAGKGIHPDMLTINMRGEVAFPVTARIRAKCRIDYRFRNYLQPGDGWHLYTEAEYRHPRPRLRLVMRHTLFSIDHYDLRVYCREPDALWAYSMAMLYGQGSRTALLIHCKNRKKFHFWLKGGVTRVIKPAAHNDWTRHIDLSAQINISF